MLEGGNICVEIDEEELQMGIEENKYSLIGRTSLLEGSDSVMTIGLKKKLESAWGFGDFALSSLGRGYYHVLITTMENQSIVMSHGPITMYPSVFRVSP